MADTFVPITFVADELLTSTKMNQLAANQANFHNGTGLGDNIIETRHFGGALQLADKMTNPYKFSASRLYMAQTAATENIPMIFDTKNYDTSNSFSTATGLYTIEISGYYHFFGQLSIANIPTNAQIWTTFIKNGTCILRGSRISATGLGTTYLPIGVDLLLASGDKVGAGIYCTGGSANIEPGANICYFGGHLISKA